MSIRKTLLAIAMATSACAVPAISQAETYVVVTPPGTAYTPAPIYERIPAAREGYVWAPGYWSRDGDRQVWISGRWVYDRDYYVRRDRTRDEERHWWRRWHHRDAYYDD
jgi:hypothetical protein